jgi:hypothetical protein
METRGGFLSFVLLLCLVTSAAAQSSSESPLLSRPVVVPSFTPIAVSGAQQAVVLAQWTHDYTEWRVWYLQWRNRPEPGFLSTRTRRLPPAPPVWLPPLCTEPMDDTGPVAEACAAWREWQADDMAASLLSEQIAQTRAATESPQKTLWWERVHVDALWPMTRAGSNAFGVAGIHATVHLTKRFQVFMLPGFILMRAPGLDGAQNWSVATDWGFSVRLFDLRVPLAARPGSVHLNMARVWMLGNSNVAAASETYLAGLSLSFKQR